MPKEHLVRKLEASIDWSFNYELAKALYCEDKVPEEQALWYSAELREEIQRDREAHGKKPLKDLEAPNDEEDKAEEENNFTGDEPPKPGRPNKNTSQKKLARQKKEKHQKVSRSDPDSGWFRKDEHKHVFAYNIPTACCKNGIILGYSVRPGNENDGRTFKPPMDKLEELPVELVVGDTAYKTPAIAKYLKDKGIALLSTYARPRTKEGFFSKYEYVYDEQYDCYLCPANEVLSCRTTNRDGYRESVSDPKKCEHCPYLAKCTQNKKFEKTVTRHVWADFVEQAEENRYTFGIKEWYSLRKETIERDFALAKELHGFRYTQMYERARMEMKSALTFACMNLKKLAKKRWRKRFFTLLFSLLHAVYATNPARASA